MSEEATELLKKALTLPLEERAELASSLMESLDLIQDEDVEAAWQEEIARRIEEPRTESSSSSQVRSGVQPIGRNNPGRSRTQGPLHGWLQAVLASPVSFRDCLSGFPKRHSGVSRCPLPPATWLLERPDLSVASGIHTLSNVVI